MTFGSELQRRLRLTRHVWWIGSALFVVILLVSQLVDLGVLPYVLIVGCWLGLFLYLASFRCTRCGWRVALQSRFVGHPQSMQHVATGCARCGLSFDAPLDGATKA